MHTAAIGLAVRKARLLPLAQCLTQACLPPIRTGEPQARAVRMLEEAPAPVPAEAGPPAPDPDLLRRGVHRADAGISCHQVLYQAAGDEPQQ